MTNTPQTAWYGVLSDGRVLACASWIVVEREDEAERRDEEQDNGCGSLGTGNGIGSVAMTRESIRPGIGWYRVGVCFDHTSGLRIHPYGLVRLPDNSLVNGNHWPLSRDMWRFIRANGGSRKRGIMAWAKSLLEADQTQ